MKDYNKEPNYLHTCDSKMLDEVYRDVFKLGYEQAEKDTIEKVRQQVERWMPDNPEGDEYISGERVAFRSVLHFLKELEDEK